MGIFGLKKSRSQGPGRALAYLADVQRLGAPLRIEDAQGREVPARIEHISGGRIHLSPESLLDLDHGAETQLVFILYGFRFKAPTSVLEASSGLTVVNLPSAINMAERRRVPRGVLNFALAGLFSPLAASGSASMETTQSFVYETSPQSSSVEGSDHHPTTSAEPPERGHHPFLNLDLASKSAFSDIQISQWLKERNVTLNDPLRFRRPTTLTGQNPFVKHIHGGPLSTRGVTYTFLTRGLPLNWRGSLHATRANFEVFFNRDHVYLGIRVK